MKCPKCGNTRTTDSVVWQIDDDKTGRLSWCWKCIADEQHDRIALLEARLKDAEDTIENINCHIIVRSPVTIINKEISDFFKRKAQREEGK